MRATVVDKRTQKLIDKKAKSILSNLLPAYQTVFMAAACVALNAEFGFGRDRLSRFIKTTEVYYMENLKEYAEDDVVSEKVRRDLERLGLR